MSGGGIKVPVDYENVRTFKPFEISIVVRLPELTNDIEQLAESVGTSGVHWSS